MRVLIAEDERTTAHLLTKLLQSWSYDVVSVQSGTEALETFVNDPNIRLVLLDWMLPGMDGPDVCRAIQETRRHRAAYVVLLTSRRAPADVIAGLQAGADDYLIKPFNHNELRARLFAGSRTINLQQHLADQVAELERVLAEVKALSGLLPICSYCKSIRDDANYWHQVEAYVAEHANVQFSHGICPNCLPIAEKQLGVATQRVR